MKNQREIYEALLAGETLGNPSMDWIIRLSRAGNPVDHKDQSVNISFCNAGDWQIYKKPAWYENIPDGGVLCWYGDTKSICVVAPIISGEDFNSENYTLLTKQEINVFLTSAPEKL